MAHNDENVRSSCGQSELYDALAKDAQRREAAQQQACAQGGHAPMLRYVGAWSGHDHWQCPYCNQIIETDAFVVTI